MVSTYEMLIASDEMTVLSEYKHVVKDAVDFESEAALERKLIEQLDRQGIEYVDITSEDALLENARKQLSRLNKCDFSESEWKQILNCIANPSMSIEERARILHRGDGIFGISYDDNSRENFIIIDKKNLHNNSVQVMHQYTPSTGRHKNRYDVTLLVNGLPMVHIELKRRGIALHEAFNQISRYTRDSFWADSGMFGWVQIFVISNGAHTRYFSNTTYQKHLANDKPEQNFVGSYSYAFMWTDAMNKPIDDLEDFSRTFLTRNTLLNVLTKYCVFTETNSLMVMRPYQIAATERILSRIKIAVMNPERLGKTIAGGYVWHTTGSGKTLTSFKCAQLASAMEGIDKVLFVVDRRDLDDQTMIEYNKFEKDAVNGATSANVLANNLADSTKKIHVTTIQKLSRFMKKYKSHSIFSKTVVFIFDECHRSQFGSMHKEITKKFSKYILFGFTGTPIFLDNAGRGKYADLITTEQAFGDELHNYTIVPAIRAGAVLRFKVDTIGRVKQTGERIHTKVQGIDEERIYHDDRRITLVSQYILDNFARHTKRSQSYILKVDTEEGHVPVKREGFNAIFATDSIDAAKRYYAKIKELQKGASNPLKVGLIYSFDANGESNSGVLDEGELVSPTGPDRDFLEMAMADYNEMFGSNYSCEGASFENYYRDVSNKMKSRELDLLIVVNMFLTGFDAKCLNTLFVDKNLRMHGLIQAFSRTNRPLDAVKSFGNIVCFRDLSKNLDEAIALFADSGASGTVMFPPYEELLEKFDALLKYIRESYNAAGELEFVGEDAEKEFIRNWSALLRYKNVLETFDEFEDDCSLTAAEFANRCSDYLDLRDKYKSMSEAEAEDVSDDLDFEMELVRQVEVTIDYILALVDKYRHGSDDRAALLVEIRRAIKSSPTYRDRQALIDEFIESVNVEGNIIEVWSDFLKGRMRDDFEELIGKENLECAEVMGVMSRAWRNGVFEADGRDVRALVHVEPPKHLSPLEKLKWSISSGDNGISHMDEVVFRVGAKLLDFFEQYYGLGIGFDEVFK